MMPPILHTALIIGLILLFYRFLLERETHFRLNRGLLVAGMVLALGLPHLSIPGQWSARNWLQLAEAPSIETPAFAPVSAPPPCEGQTASLPESSPLSFAVPPASPPQALNPSAALASPAVALPQLPRLSSWQWVLMAYLLGVLLAGGRLLVQLFFLFRNIRQLPRQRKGRYLILELPAGRAAYSFFHYIFINPAAFDATTYQQVLAHEKIHADQKHSLDILLAELLVVLQWFNPFVWLYRKAVKENLEYLTDEQMLQKNTDPRIYQFSLLRASVPQMPALLVANYSQTLLKKRILMMNATKSPIHSAWKSLFLLPLLALSVSLLNAEMSPSSPLALAVISLADVPTGPLTTSPLPDSAAEQSALPARTKPCKPQVEPQRTSLDFFTSTDLSGTWEGLLKTDELCLRIIRSVEEDWNWTNHDCYPFSEFEPQNVSSAATFSLSRQAGKLNFTGTFSKKKGAGDFTFEENATYRKKLEKEGIQQISSELMFQLMFRGDDAGYVENLKNLQGLGLAPATLADFMVEGVDATYVKKYLEAGISVEKQKDFLRSRVEAELLQAYQAAGLDLQTYKSFIHSRVEPELLKEYQSAGLDVEKYKSFIHSRVEPGFLKEYQSAGLDVEKYKSFIHSRVEPDFLKTYQAAGLDVEKYKSFIHSRVEPELLKEYQAAGLDVKEYKSFIHSRVEPDFLKTYQAAGLDLMKHKTFIHSRVEPDFLKTYQAAGLDLMKHKTFIHSRVEPDFLKTYQAANMDLGEYKSFIYSRVEAGLLKEYQAAGLDLVKHKSFIHSRVEPSFLKTYQAAGLDLETYKSFVLSRVNPDFLKEYQAAGMDLEEYKSFIHSRVDPDLLKEYQAAGLDLLKYKSLIHSRIEADFLKEYLDAGYAIEDHRDFINRRIDASFLQKYEQAGLSIEEHREFILDRVDPAKVKRYLEGKE